MGALMVLAAMAKRVGSDEVYISDEGRKKNSKEFTKQLGFKDIS